MRLYHGTNAEIEAIDLNMSKVGKDFGCGFYLTPDLVTAKNQAQRRADIDGGNPVVNVYEFDEALLADMAVVRYDGYSTQWAEFVKANRNNRSRTQLHDFDIVIGPIANDDIGMQMRKFNAGRITLEQFMKAIEWKEVTIQYFFGTERSIRLLTKINGSR